MATATALAQADSPSLSCDQILSVARHDAERVYRDLALFNVHLTQESDGWHVDFVPRNPNSRGGGPHYVIDAVTGQIIGKRYEQ